ncbi:class I adenylate-forming enzyme family protein [Mycobacterium sp. URHB0044]|uniref:class I adenylate-forming enzyme family protein n=1 Tax=Mycobacterium sp. URHB0044 TaxID=1380386 RepID=UPI001E4072B8|nr:class I adenylate-forming enzyme family protein [Mycobacterium sp. URHB0044]
MTVAPPREGRSYVSGLDEFVFVPASVGDALIALSADAADEPALMWIGESVAEQMSWSQLADRALRALATLLELNPDRRRVALVGPNSVDWVVAMFACALGGMPVVPISATATADEARHQLARAAVGVVLADEAKGVLDHIRATAPASSPSPVVRALAGLCGTKPASPLEVSADDEFLVQFTSGTTGLPKAASLSHRAALNTGAVFARACGARKGDRWFNPLPLHHVGGLVTGMLSVVSFGGAYTVVERFSPRIALDAIRQIQPAWAGLVPTMVIDILGLPGVNADDFASVRTVAAGASAVNPQLIDDMEARLGVTTMVGYGQSEAPAMAASSPDDVPRVRTQTLGRCLPGRELAIRNDAGTVLPTGMVGELCVRGPLCMSGYLRTDGTLDPAVDAEGWLRTGDLCSMDDDGVLVFHGRLREVIIRGGLNVYPAEVEQALSTHESVGELTVFGVSDLRLGERVVAAVIPAGPTAVDVGELAALADEKLNRYKRPSEYFVVSQFPRTSSGKVRKHVLQKWYAEGVLDH